MYLKTALKLHIIKEKTPQIDDPSSHLNNLGNEGQNKPKTSRKK